MTIYLEKLSEQMAKFAGHHTFVDEFVIDIRKDDDDDGEVQKLIWQMKTMTRVKIVEAMKSKQLEIFGSEIPFYRVPLLRNVGCTYYWCPNKPIYLL